MTVGQLRQHLDGLREDMEVVVEIEREEQPDLFGNARERRFMGTVGDVVVETRCDDVPSLYLQVFEPEET